MGVDKMGVGEMGIYCSLPHTKLYYDYILYKKL